MDKENPNKEGLYFHNEDEEEIVKKSNLSTRLLLEIVHKLGRIADALEEANMQDG